MHSNVASNSTHVMGQSVSQVAYLPVFCFPPQLLNKLVYLAHAGCAYGVALGLKAAACIYRQAAIQICCSVPYQIHAFSRPGKTQVLIGNYLQGGKGVMHLCNAYIRWDYPC